MRRAAMIHFRKIQKMKATQSKVWQISNKNTKNIKNTQNVGESSSRGLDPEKIEENVDKNILLTGIY